MVTVKVIVEDGVKKYGKEFDPYEVAVAIMKKAVKTVETSFGVAAGNSGFKNGNVHITYLFEDD